MAAEQPKKPAGGAYGRFLAEKRTEIVKMLPAGHKITDVTKKASELWKACADKPKYEALYKAAQAKYLKAVEDFTAGGGVVVRKSKKDKNKKLKKDVDAPKKPAGGGYGRFMAEKRDEIRKSLPAGANPISDVAKEAGRRFKALPESERARYDALFKTAQAEYKKKLEEYNATKKDEGGEEEEPVAKSPKKRKAADGQKSPAKRVTADKKEKPAKRVAKATPAGVELSDDILTKARSAGYEAQLKNLALRPEVVTSGKPATDLLKALMASNGLVNPAKNALLSA